MDPTERLALYKAIAAKLQIAALHLQDASHVLLKLETHSTANPPKTPDDEGPNHGNPDDLGQ